jgi:hypothetical protein
MKEQNFVKEKKILNLQEYFIRQNENFKGNWLFNKHVSKFPRYYYDMQTPLVSLHYDIHPPLILSIFKKSVELILHKH